MAYCQRRATLYGWENNTKLFIKDLSGNYGGRFYDRGLFRMHTHSMDMEYQLDMLTYQFSFFDEYEWTIK
ncbi:MAG TPA: hypothetical protein VJ941_05520, partial [Gracilimonas sp.]|nr:hypothetical protein [Gracilimonas sp.]